MKQDAIAVALNVDKSTVSRWVSGETGIPLDRLQEFLKSVELKAVPLNAEVIDPDEKRALELFARKWLESQK